MRTLFAAILLCAPFCARGDAKLEARAHFKLAAAYYEAGRYDEAIVEYRAAYQTLPLPDFLFNIGQAARLKGDRRLALDSYRSYLEAAPDGRAAAEAREHLVELTIAEQKDATRRAEEEKAAGEKRVAEDAAQSAAAERAAAERAAADKASAEKSAAERARQESDAASEARRARQLKLAGVPLLSVGAGLLVLGGAFTGLASQADHEFLHPSNGVYSRSAESRRASYQSAEIAGFAAGGALAVTGLALYLVGGKQAHRWSFAAAAGRESASLNWEYRY